VQKGQGTGVGKRQEERDRGQEKGGERRGRRKENEGRRKEKGKGGDISHPTDISKVDTNVYIVNRSEALNFRGSRDWPRSIFRKFCTGYVRTITGNMHVRFEVRRPTFNRVRVISI